MRRRFVVEAELTIQSEATPKEVDDIMKNYIRNLKQAGIAHWVGKKMVVNMETESIQDEQGQEVMTPWPSEEKT